MEKAKKVWIVIWYEDSDSNVFGVYTTKEKAERAVKEEKKKGFWGPNTYWSIIDRSIL
jgi:hypothetical protein